MPRLRAPSPALGVALVSLFVALGGTTWAAVSLPASSVGTTQLKANAVTGGKVANHSLTGADIALARLGTVPSARHAVSADSARVAGTAYSTHFETAVGVPSSPTLLSSLSVPGGSYLLSAKGQVDTLAANAIVECDLVAGGDVDKSFVQGGATHQSQIVTNSLVHVFPSAGTVSLTCQSFASGGLLSQVRVTALRVGTVIDSP